MEVKADLKHWWTRVDGDNNVSNLNYSKFADEARKNLGENGIFSVTNARGYGHGLGEDKRAEILLDDALKGNDVDVYEQEGVFYDSGRKLWFIKGQEFRPENSDANLLFLGIPFDKSIGEGKLEKGLKEAEEMETINGFLGFSGGLKDYEGVNDKVNFFVTFCGFYEAARKGNLNQEAMNFYRNNVSDVREVAVSGGHRFTSGFWKVFGKPSIGSSYTVLDMPVNIEGDSFKNNLKEALKNPKHTEKRKGPFSEVLRHTYCMVKDKISS